jgi:hypothetical protein
MPYKKPAFFFVLAGISLLIATGIFLATAAPVRAQCGSQASSCKNCHEVQGQDAVNADGTGWHQSHAFGDFCYICHAGNNQATEKAAAHEGMIAPMSDIQAACQQCHVADLQERAQVYATALGIELSAGGEAAPAPATGAEPAAAPAAVEPAASSVTGSDCTALAVDDPNVVSYAQNYDQVVLGKKPINWGNTILGVMIVAMLVGGGGFVITREKLVKLSFGDTRAVEGEYPADVIEMLPQLAALDGRRRKSLRNILAQPKKADKVLDLMDAVITGKTDEE